MKRIERSDGWRCGAGKQLTEGMRRARNTSRSTQFWHHAIESQSRGSPCRKTGTAHGISPAALERPCPGGNRSVRTGPGRPRSVVDRSFMVFADSRPAARPRRRREPRTPVPQAAARFGKLTEHRVRHSRSCRGGYRHVRIARSPSAVTPTLMSERDCENAMLGGAGIALARAAPGWILSSCGHNP